MSCGAERVDPLDPWRLADHLDIPVKPLSSMRAYAPFAAYHFSRVDSVAFSAVTIFRGRERHIIHNDSHSRGELASNLAHELARWCVAGVRRDNSDDCSKAIDAFSSCAAL